MTGSAAMVIGHRRARTSWSALPSYARLVGLGPRTHIHAPDLRLFVSLHVNVDNTAAHSPRGSNPPRTRAYVHETGAPRAPVTFRCSCRRGATSARSTWRGFLPVVRVVAPG